MLKYTIKRVLMLIPTIIGITLFIYLIMSFVPGDPAELLSPPEATAEEVEVLRAELGLDKPVLVQYVNYMWDILHGDFGVSWFTKQPVIDSARYADGGETQHARRLYRHLSVSALRGDARLLARYHPANLS